VEDLVYEEPEEVDYGDDADTEPPVITLTGAMRLEVQKYPNVTTVCDDKHLIRARCEWCGK
jgi:hypothetical protein